MTKKERTAILEGYRAHSRNNEIEILRSQKCGCFFCGKTYSARKISEWESGTNGGASAICPMCGMTAVLGDASGVPLTKALLKEMSTAFFEGDLKGKTPEALNDFIDRYVPGKIPHNAKNENLFLSYLAVLVTMRDPRAYILLGDFWSGSAEHHKPDYDLAILFYSDPIVAFDTYALCRLGCLYFGGHGPKKSKMLCMEAFTKAAALGSLEAVFRIADCYHSGYPVKKDDYFAFRAILNGFTRAYSDFFDCQMHLSLLPEFAYRLAKCAQNGWGVEAEENYALKYFLIARFSALMKSLAMNVKRNSPMLADIEAQVKALASSIGAKPGDPLYDTDTFFDTFGDPNTPDDSEKKFRLISYDQEAETLVFEMETKHLWLLVDTANLYCGISKPKTQWSFIDVVGFEHNGESEFNEIVVKEDGYSFLRYGDDPDHDVTIAEIRLRQQDESEPKSGQEALNPKKEG